MKIASSNINNVRRRPLNLAMARSGETTDAIVDMKPQPEYHNAENGFCVLRAKARGRRDVVTVVGHAAAVFGW